jgi:hypothetical protein
MDGEDVILLPKGGIPKGKGKPSKGGAAAKPSAAAGAGAGAAPSSKAPAAARGAASDGDSDDEEFSREGWIYVGRRVRACNSTEAALSPVAPCTFFRQRGGRTRGLPLTSLAPSAFPPFPRDPCRIPHGFYEDQMRAYFSQFGELLHVQLARSRKTARSKGFAFLQFAAATDAAIAAATMNGYPLENKVLQSHVVEPEKVHRGMFRYADRKWAKIPWRKIVREAQQRPRSEEQVAKKVGRMLGREARAGAKLKALGIDYELGDSFAKQAEESGLFGGEDSDDEEDEEDEEEDGAAARPKGKAAAGAGAAAAAGAGSAGKAKVGAGAAAAGEPAGAGGAGASSSSAVPQGKKKGSAKVVAAAAAAVGAGAAAAGAAPAAAAAGFKRVRGAAVADEDGDADMGAAAAAAGVGVAGGRVGGAKPAPSKQAKAQAPPPPPPPPPPARLQVVGMRVLLPPRRLRPSPPRPSPPQLRPRPSLLLSLLRSLRPSRQPRAARSEHTASAFRFASRARQGMVGSKMGRIANGSPIISPSPLIVSLRL